jgi:hypothetical protein
MEHLHQSKPVMANEAKEFIFAFQSCAYGSPRRCAARDDGLMQTFSIHFFIELARHEQYP